MGDFHFLRPLLLVLVPIALALPFAWRRRRDPRRAWEGVIAPHLLEALLVGVQGRRRVRPVDGAALALGLAAIAAAGPTWRREPPPFAQDQAALVVALDLSATMSASDVAPSRLERAKQKVHDLVAARGGARTGLVVYAGSAHVVVPPSEDPELLDLYLDALAPELMPRAGRDVDAALAAADALLARETYAGTVLFVTDGADPATLDAFAKRARASRDQVLVLAVGSDPAAGFDAAALQRLADAARAPIASLTADDGDVRWVVRRAQSHLQVALDAEGTGRWRESGYWLCFPLAALGLLSFRRGWVVRWAAGVLLALTLGGGTAAPAHANPLVDLFLTPDQQGRLAFERGDFAAAAKHFADPLWQGLALYRAADYAGAEKALARAKGAEASFRVGNARARKGDFEGAVAAYDAALQARPAFPEAEANKKLVAALIPPPGDSGDPTEPPDEIQFDEKGKKGKAGRTPAAAPSAQEAELWLRRLRPSPAKFLAS